MYEAFFGLQQEPFSIAPDPRFLYMSDKHREALALLNFGLSRGASFVLLTGEIGAGKTTVWRRFLEELPSNFDIANVVNPRLDVVALLSRVCEDLGVELPAGGRPVDLIDALHGHLLLSQAQGRRTLIVIDEAQALSDDVLEQLRLLTNLDFSGKKLQVMLIGQPELRQMLERPQLEPLAQRVVARYHLPALSAAESVAYIEHRLKVAGLQGEIPFDPQALAAIHRLCHGIPRRINVLCDRALIAAYAQGLRRVDERTVVRAATETFGDKPLASTVARRQEQRRSQAPLWFALACGAALAVGAGLLLGPRLMALPQRMLAAPAAPTAASTPQATAPAAAPLAIPRVNMPLPSIDAAFSSGPADEATAWRVLAGLWGSTLVTGEPCDAASLRGLQCFRSRGGLAQIRLLDRPGILKLVDERGRVAHVLLTGLADDSVTLVIAGVERSVPLTHLARLWRGDFATLWQTPPGYREGEAPANGSALWRWMTERLADVDRQGPVAPGEAALRARLFAFQLASGLTPDGLAGPLTLMQLNRASGMPEPRLKSSTSGSRPS